MAQPVTTGKFLLLLGNGATPTEVFSFPCGANARSLTLRNNLGEVTTLDCTNPLTGGAWVTRFLESQDTQLSISGVVDRAFLAEWRTWADDGTMKNVRAEFQETSANGGGYWTVGAYLQDFEITKEGVGDKPAEFSATIMGSGPRVWTAATP